MSGFVFPNQNLALPITLANGGTGQATKAPAFDALAPTANPGELIERGASSNVALAPGTVGQVLTMGVTGFPGWSTPSAPPSLPVSIANGGTGQITANPAFAALAPMTANGDLITRAAGIPAVIPIGSAAQVLTVVGGAPAWAAAGGGSGTKLHIYEACIPGLVSATAGHMSRASLSSANPPGLYQTTGSGNPGINNGANDCWVVLAAQTIKRATLRVAHAATGIGSFSSPASCAFDIYTLGYSTRTLLGTLNFQVTNADTNNALGSDRFAALYSYGPFLGTCGGRHFRCLNSETKREAQALSMPWAGFT